MLFQTTIFGRLCLQIYDFRDNSRKQTETYRYCKKDQISVRLLTNLSDIKNMLDVARTKPCVHRLIEQKFSICFEKFSKSYIRCLSQQVTYLQLIHSMLNNPELLHYCFLHFHIINLITEVENRILFCKRDEAKPVQNCNVYQTCLKLA